MQKNKIKVYFLGSGAFAVPFLDALNKAENIELVGVGTQPDKPSGRKRLPKPTPLGGFADAVGIPCRRVESVSSDEFMQLMNELVPDLVVVVSFGQLLREKLLNFPRLGCLNVHGSILPKYRGASPLATSILSGDKVNGITFMRMDKGLDTGPVYSVVTMDVPPSMNTQTLEIALSELGSRNIAGIIDRIAEGLQPVPQNEPDATLTRKIHKSDGSVHWDEPAGLLERKVRAYYPWPGLPLSASTERTDSCPSKSPKPAFSPNPARPEPHSPAIKNGSSPADRAHSNSSASSRKAPAK